MGCLLECLCIALECLIKFVFRKKPSRTELGKSKCVIHSWVWMCGVTVSIVDFKQEKTQKAQRGLMEYLVYMGFRLEFYHSRYFNVKGIW
jgi:hypothetical protein